MTLLSKKINLIILNNIMSIQNFNLIFLNFSELVYNYYFTFVN